MPNEIKLYGEIGEDITAVEVKNALDAMDQTQPLVVRIHSEGGAVNEGLAIYDAFKAYAGPKKAIIESAAFSIASHIAMAFEDVEITENGYLMIHNPHMELAGDATAHAQAATTLAKLESSMVDAYSSKTGKPRDEVLAIMAKETFINARDAIAGGFANRVIAPKQMKAVAKTKNIPKGVLESLCGDSPKTEPLPTKDLLMSTEPIAATIEEIEAKFPSMKPERILACVKQKLPMASVMTEALAAMEEELTAAKAKLAQYEQDMAAKAAMEVSVEEEPKEEEMAAKAKAKSGVKPVAKAAGSVKPSAKAQWENLVSAKVSAGLPKAKAVLAIAKEHPGLREQMVEEVNSARKDSE